MDDRLARVVCRLHVTGLNAAGTADGPIYWDAERGAWLIGVWELTW